MKRINEQNFLCSTLFIFIEQNDTTMKAIHFFKLLAIALIALLYGCTSHVKDVQERMTDNYHLYMNQQVASINSSLEEMHNTIYVDSGLKKGITLSGSLKTLLKKKFFKAIPSAIFQFELSSVGNNKISLKQYAIIRKSTVLIMKDSLKKYIVYTDKNIVNLLVDTLLFRYSEQFPVNNAFYYYKQQRELSGTFLQFVETENEGYCNEENILPGDCNWGYIFLATNGKSIFKLECVGSDSTQYNIGTFERKTDSLVCSFEKSYSYPEKYDPNTGVSISNPNEGKISDGSFVVKLQHCQCIKYPFIIKHMNEEDGNSILQTYVVKVASLKEQDDFIKSIKNIKSISDILKE